jgi:hypothetical protein
MTPRSVTLAVLLLASVLLGVEHTAAQSPSAGPQARGAAAEPLPPWPDLQNLQATRDRPLFVPSRRPPSAPPPPDVEEVAVEAESSEAPFELAGIITGEDVAIAVLRNKSNQETQNVRRGQTLENWTLAEIQSQAVVLRRGGTKVRLKLFEEGKSRSRAPTDLGEDDDGNPIAAPGGPVRIIVKRVDENGNVVQQGGEGAVTSNETGGDDPAGGMDPDNNDDEAADSSPQDGGNEDSDTDGGANSQ